MIEKTLINFFKKLNSSTWTHRLSYRPLRVLFIVGSFFTSIIFPLKFVSIRQTTS